MSGTDRGSITPYGMIFVLILMLFVGLVVDGGAKLQAGWEAVGIAEEAARAGAGEVDQQQLYSGTRNLTVDQAAAVRAARAYLASTGHPGSVQVTGPQQLTVRVRVTKSTWILSVLGLSSVSQTATATAEMAHGISRRRE